MFNITKQDQFLAKQGVFTLEYIEKAYQDQSPRLAEFICKLVHLDPAPREMFIEQNRGGSTFAIINQQIIQSVSEQRVIIRNTPSLKVGESNRVSPVLSAPYIWQGHQKVWDHLTSDTMKDLLPERVGIHGVIMDLWNDSSSYARTQLLMVLRFVRMAYGAWKALKTIFKEAEVRFDWEVYAILDQRFSQYKGWQTLNPKYLCITKEDQAAKEAEMATIREQEERQQSLQAQFDALENTEENQLQREELEAQISQLQESITEAYANRDLEPSVENWDYLEHSWEQDRFGQTDVTDDSYAYSPSSKTMEYLRRRAARTMRNLAKDFPEAFVGAAAEMLMGMRSTSATYMLTSDGGYEDLWKQPSGQQALMKIVEQSKNADNVTWAYEFLKEHFRKDMKKVDADWLYRVSQSKFDFTHTKALDYLQNVTGIEKGMFKDAGYHKTIIDFLGFGLVKHGYDAINFAVEYLLMVGADPTNDWIVIELPLEKVATLMRSSARQVRELGMSLMSGKDGKSPYEDSLKGTDGLNLFTILLGDRNTVDFAMEQICMRGYTLPPEWFVEQLGSDLSQARQFAHGMLEDPQMVSSDVDWTDFAMSLLRQVPEQIADASTVYGLAWDKLTSVDIHGKTLLPALVKNNMDFVRFLFVHPSAQVRQYAMTLVQEEICTAQDFGLGFLKAIATKREYLAQLQRDVPFAEFSGEFTSSQFGTYLNDNKDNGVYGDNVGKMVRGWLSNQELFSLNDLGLEWAFARLEYWQSDYDFVRQVFKRDVTLPQVGGLLPPLSKDEFTSEDAVINSARQIAWYIYDKCLDAGSKRANFYKSLLKERNGRYREHKRLSGLSADCVWPSKTFDFAWFTRWARSKREPIRQFAIEMSRFEMAYWVGNGKVGFTDIRPFFNGYFDVQSAIVKSIYNPPQPLENSRIDLEELKEGFKAQDLYPYCFTDNQREVDFALQLILDYPELYGKPDDLLSLSDAKDARVRQTVIMVMWSLYKVPTTTPGWRPFPYSVVPFDPSKAKDPVRDTKSDPNKLTGKDASFGKASWFIGTGNKEGALAKDRKMNAETRFDLHEFLRRILYSLPRNPDVPTAEEAARQAQMERQMGVKTAKKEALNASWKNKKTLVESIRDLAIRPLSPADMNSMSDADIQSYFTEQKEFAQFMLPVLEEFTAVRGKMLHNATLTAVVQMKATHQL